jgi:hypothetical protein
MTDVETLNSQMRLVITNGQFNFSMGAPATTEVGSESSSQIGQ